MKVTRTEKIWLVLGVLFYLLYNFPGFPKYNDPVMTIVHGALTVIPIWVVCYAGLYIINKKYKIRNKTDQRGNGL